jgi:Cu+-exporting ATPase
LSGRGILVRGGTPLEVAARAVNVVLDKTGTITIGEPKVAGIESFDLSQDKLLQIAASVEAGFNHPIANAIISHASTNGVRPLKAERSEYLPGLGIKSSVERSQVLLGSDETMNALGMTAPLDLKVKGRAVWIGIDGKIAGAIVIQDELRDYAKGLGHALHELGMRRVELATGDNEVSEARRVAELIGSDGYHWGLKPEEKTAIVKDLSAQGPTVMVGDGVNDAISLAAAEVGVSIGGAKADLAIKSSDIVVLRDDATSLLGIIKMGKKLIGVIKQNYAWAIGFNTVGIALATAGVLSPWLAALFHHMSSVLVVLNSARLVHNKALHLGAGTGALISKDARQTQLNIEVREAR